MIDGFAGKRIVDAGKAPAIVGVDVFATGATSKYADKPEGQTEVDQFHWVLLARLFLGLLRKPGPGRTESLTRKRKPMSDHPEAGLSLPLNGNQPGKNGSQHKDLFGWR